jgi:predicted TPR repeat methyltransferase
LKLAASGYAVMPDNPPTAYVETLFDAYAPTFETALLQKLHYRVPELLAKAIKAVAPARHYRSMLDVGCGTGLMGDYFRADVDHMAGMDLSEAMLQKAEEKRVYDRLFKGDVNELDYPAGSADLIIAADVFVYVGDLDKAFSRLVEALGSDGLFAFSVETHVEDGELILQSSLRYTHSQAYVRRVLAEHGLVASTIDREAIRFDRGEPLQGLIVVARRA